MPATATDRLSGLTTSVAVKPPCVAVTSANITLSGLQTIGGVALAEGDRVLVRAQTNSVDNGIYDASTSGWTRAKDFDGARDVTRGTLVLVRTGSVDGAIYEMTTANPVIGISTIAFTLRSNPAITYVQTQAEIDATVTPANYAYAPGDVRRQGMTDDSATDFTVAFQQVINAAAGIVPVLVPRVSGGYYRLTGRITAPAGTHIILQNGAELRWTATTATGTNFIGNATSPGFEITGDNFIVSGNGTLRGPTTSGTFVLNECCLYYKGATTSARGSGITILGKIDIKNWGSYGVLAQFVNYIQIASTVRIFDCGYAGVLLASCNSARVDPDVSNITPGTGGNAYGISFSHDSTNYNLDQTVNPFCRDIYCSATVSDVPLWTGIDSHGGNDIHYIGAKVYNCRFGYSIASGSGAAANYAGENNEIIGCVATTLKRDGSATTVSGTPTGITCDGGSTVAHRGLKIIGNTLDGYGDSTGTYSISAIRVQDGIIADNVIRNWKGIGINADSAGNLSINTNTFGPLASATLSKCIKVSGTGSYSFTGNKHKPSSGTAVLEGLRVDDAATPRIVATANDFNAATSQVYANDTGGLLDGTRFRDNSDVMPRIDVTGTPTTISVAAAGLAPEVWVNLGVSGPSTVTDITGAFIGQRITLYSPTANVTTFDRTNAALAGGANYVSSQFDILELLCINTAGVKFVEIGRSANS